MGTVSKKIADDIIAGKYASEDGWPHRIVEYENSFDGSLSYGVEHHESEIGKYSASRFVINPRVYWERR